MMMFHGIASRVVDRSLRPLSKVRPGEGVSAVLMLACIFLLLSSYYVLKTAREGIILSSGTFGLRGDELKAYATGGMAVFLAVLVPLYGRLANRVRRIVLINTTYAVVAGCLPIFYVLNAVGVAVGLTFYVWLGIVSLLLTAQFWSYATDIYTEEQGKRLFPIVAVGGSLGAIVGPRLAKLADTFTLLPIACLMLIVCLALLNAIERHDGRQEPHLVASPITGPGGFSLILRDRYLLLIALLLLIANLVNTTGEYILSNAVREQAIAATSDKNEQRELIKTFYGNFYSWVNLVTFAIQAFLVSRLIDKFGVRRMLFVLPILVMSAYSAVALVGGIAIIRMAKLSENSVDYSLQNTLRQTLFLPVERVAKYKAKAAIDTFCVRAGDLLSALLVGIGLHRLGMHRTSFALANIGLAALWIPLCIRLVRHHRARSYEPNGHT
jgi:ATP:ADP antiporter, AAA family